MQVAVKANTVAAHKKTTHLTQRGEEEGRAAGSCLVLRQHVAQVSHADQRRGVSICILAELSHPAETHLFVECFPYVCPEPALVK